MNIGQINMNIINPLNINQYSMIIEDTISDESFSRDFNTFYQYNNSVFHFLQNQLF